VNTGASETGALAVLAARQEITPSLIVGLGAAVYFEYYRRAEPPPSHYISALRRNFEQTLEVRLAEYRVTPHAAVRAALMENARWFNLDRAATTALLGMEMLAEELPEYHSIPDWQACFQEMAETINCTNALHRRTLVTFLRDVALYIPEACACADELDGIASEWRRLATHLTETVQLGGGSRFEQASRWLRRLALREEHFWGTILEW
jgi:hypothetical protein